MRTFAFAMLRLLRIEAAAALLLMAMVASGFNATIATGAELVIWPAEVVLSDAFARRQLRVELASRDVTHEARFASEQPEIAAIDPLGYVTPLADGAATLRIEAAGQTARVPVRISGCSDGRQIDFRSELAPLLSRHGCNSGGCHGKQAGQNGFQLSLFGFDTQFDYEAIVQQARGRRIATSRPAASLLLQKATGQTPHGGGARFDTQSEAYQLIHRWIKIGAPAAAANAPQLVALHITPSERVMQPAGQVQLVAEAEYEDGSRRDVTRQAQFSSNLEAVASVNDNGQVLCNGETGEAAVLVRYRGAIAVFTAIAPHASPLDSIAGFKPNNYVDELAAAKWRKLGLTPSPPCDDATFLRRVTADLCGRLPTIEETKAFLADSSAAKRSAAIDRLLASPDYPAYFALRWGTILRNSQLAGADQAAYAFHNWLREMIARNRPYDELVRGVVAAAGQWQDAPAINWYWQMRDDQLHQVTADTAQVFLGVRLQCARCHHHPYERWGQEDYFGLAGFFTRLGRKSFGQPPPYYAASQPTTGERNPLTGEVPKPKFPDGEYAEFAPEEDPRHALVDWMVQPENPFFARVLVNRLWGHFMGRGLVHEIDDLRESNPPSNPELLDALARDFIDHKFDMQHIIRTLANSRVYQLASEPTEGNRDDRQNFARFYARRMIAEVFHDALDQACGVNTDFNGVAKSARAIDLPHEGFGSYFLDTFDRPRRVSGCECERSSGATLAQVLLLANSDEVENKIASGEGRVAKAIAAMQPPSEAIDELYLASFSRWPTEEERRATLAFVEKQENKQRALEDVLWSLVNSKEFMFSH